MEPQPCPHCRRRPKPYKVAYQGGIRWACWCRQLDCYGSMNPAQVLYPSRNLVVAWWNSGEGWRDAGSWGEPMPWIKKG
jgi:hypothetical protein